MEACRLPDTCRLLNNDGGYHTSVIKTSFAAIGVPSPNRATPDAIDYNKGRVVRSDRKTVAMITIGVYPAKGFNSIDRDTADVLDGGTLAYDREFTLHDTDDVMGSSGKKGHRRGTHIPVRVR